MKSFIILITLFSIFARAEEEIFKAESEASAIIVSETRTPNLIAQKLRIPMQFQK